MLVSHSPARRRLDVFHSKRHRADISEANLAQVLALFLQKSFWNLGLEAGGPGGQELGIDSLSRKRRERRNSNRVTSPEVSSAVVAGSGTGVQRTA